MSETIKGMTVAFKQDVQKEQEDASHLTRNLKRIAKKRAREVYGQREEILQAFIAKYECDPNDALQCLNVSTGQWYVRKMTPSEMKTRDSGIMRELIE